MIGNYFQGSNNNPYHLSIGAVVLNEKGEVCCHYFEKTVAGSKYGNCYDFYVLMRETIEPNESLEACLARGLQEEFGMKAELKKYIGSLNSHWINKDNVKINKTTLYFLCNLISIDISSRLENDAENFSIIKWMDINELILKMDQQAKKYGVYTTLDESTILRNIAMLQG